jgi:hypothetical protein
MKKRRRRWIRDLSDLEIKAFMIPDSARRVGRSVLSIYDCSTLTDNAYDHEPSYSLQRANLERYTASLRD